ncbi:MAG: hypothetical protein AAFQ95_00300 [Cyanobacteria bacterium J06621_3]
MTTARLSFNSLLAELTGGIGPLADPRQPSNASRYSLKDVVLGAFSCFFMQSASFLDYQRQLDSRNGRNNAQSLFGIEKLPSIPQLRNILDQTAASGLSEVFINIYRALHQQGYEGSRRSTETCSWPWMALTTTVLRKLAALAAQREPLAMAKSPTLTKRYCL